MEQYHDSWRVITKLNFDIPHALIKRLLIKGNVLTE